MFEVEIKYRVSSLADLRKVVSSIASPLGVSEEEDHYFNHPCRDFGATDEAVRIRLHGDGEVIITYKGPRLGSVGKTRMEINIKVDDFKNAVEFLRQLGFSEVVSIRKRREIYTVDKYTIYLDDAGDLGSFVEVETMVSSEQLTDATAKDILRFSEEKLGLAPTQIEPRTYLELAMGNRR